MLKRENKLFIEFLIFLKISVRPFFVVFFSNLNEKSQFLLTKSLSPFFLDAPDPFRALQSIKHTQQLLRYAQIQKIRLERRRSAVGSWNLLELADIKKRMGFVTPYLTTLARHGLDSGQHPGAS